MAPGSEKVVLLLFDNGTYELFDTVSTHRGAYRFTRERLVLTSRGSTWSDPGPSDADHDRLVAALKTVESSDAELVAVFDDRFVVTNRGWSTTFCRRSTRFPASRIGPPGGE